MAVSLNFLQHIWYLKQLPRTGWLFAGVRQPESIADHSYATAWTALLLAEEINQDYAAQGLTAPLDCAQVMQIALVHDLAESVLTDLPKRSAELLGKEQKHRAEAEAIEVLLKPMPNGDAYIASWYAYTESSTPEARLVRDADKLELLFQALRYAESGYQNLQDFWEGHSWTYPASEALWQTLCQQRTEG
ncbi:MAG: HD domain-containing protein [Caldilineaceae bacterium]|nr:HD domain-containing protein [Caldilineaceae bacterium]